MIKSYVLFIINYNHFFQYLLSHFFQNYVTSRDLNIMLALEIMFIHSISMFITQNF